MRVAKLILCFSSNLHCVKRVRIRSYSGPYFPAFGLNNSEYGLFLRSVMQANNGCSPLLYIHQEKCLKQGANMEICTKVTNSQYS